MKAKQNQLETAGRKRGKKKRSGMCAFTQRQSNHYAEWLSPISWGC